MLVTNPIVKQPKFEVPRKKGKTLVKWTYDVQVGRLGDSETRDVIDECPFSTLKEVHSIREEAVN